MCVSKLNDVVMSHLQDELSRYIYNNRVLFNNGDKDALKRIINASGGGGFSEIYGCSL